MSRAIWILAVLLSHWRRHPMQLATLLIGVISATALWSGVQALNREARASYDRAAAIFGGTRDRDAGRSPRRDLAAAAFCRSAPRRVAGVARSRRPGSDRRAIIPAAGYRAGHVAGRTRPGAGDRQSRSAIVPHAARRDAGGARNALRTRSAGRCDRRRRAAAHRCRRCACSRKWCRACWWSISASRNGC